VYLAEDTKEAGTLYAVKEFSEIALFRAEERRSALQSYERALRQWTALRHRNLPRIVETFSYNRKHYLVMTYINGWNLAQIIRSASLRLSEEIIINWAVQLCDVLGYLHMQDPPLVFDALKPRHVMVTRSGLIQLVDFNLGRFFTPGIVEQPDKGSPLSDIRALGMLLYSLLTRRETDRLPRQRRGARRFPRGTSKSLIMTILQATRRDPTSRFRSMAEFREALVGNKAIEEVPLLTDWLRAARSVTAKEVSARPVQEQRKVQAKPSLLSPASPRLYVRPKYLDFGTVAPAGYVEKTVTIRNVGEGRLIGQLITQKSWLVAPSSRFHCDPGGGLIVHVAARGDQLPPDGADEPQALLVDSNAGRQWIGARAAIPRGPILSVQTATMDFGEIQGDDQATLPLVITNQGAQTLHGHVTSRLPWVRLRHSSFRCPPSRMIQIPVVVSARYVPPGAHHEPEAIVVDSDAGQERVEVRVTRVQPMLNLDREHIAFGAVVRGDSAKQSLRIHNEGSGTLVVTLHSQVPWLEIQPTRVRCMADEWSEVSVTVHTKELAEGSTEVVRAIRVESNGGNRLIAATIQVLVPHLSLVQDRLDFGELPPASAASRNLQIANVGEAPLHGRVQTVVDWLQIAPQEFICAPAETVELTVTVDTSPFSHGQVVRVDRAIQISTNDGQRDIAVSLTVLLPALTVEPNELDFGFVDPARPSSLTLGVTNSGTGVLEWVIRTDCDWVEVAPRQGVCLAGQTAQISATAYALALPKGTESTRGVLEVRSNAGGEMIPLRIALASPRLEVDTTVLDLGTSVNLAPVVGSLSIFNRGLGVLRGTIESTVDWLTVDHAYFELPTGTSHLVQVHAHPESLDKSREADPALLIVDSNGGRAEITVHLEVLRIPIVKIATEILYLRPNETNECTYGTLRIANTGQAAAHITISPNVPWLEIKRKTLTIKPGKSVRVRIEAIGPLPVDWKLDAPVIEVEMADRTVRVPVEIQTPLR